MHSFEVHSNESACRKSGRLGLEQVYSGVTLDSRNMYFVDISLDIGGFKADIETFQLVRIIYGINKFLFCNIFVLEGAPNTFTWKAIFKWTL